MNVIDGRQLKAGRVVLGLTIQEMATLSGLNRNSVRRVETQQTLAMHSHAADLIQDALESKGLTFSVQEGLANISFKCAQHRKRCNYKKRDV